MNAAGGEQNRDTGAVPSSLRVTLLTDAGDDTALPISTSTVKTDAVGAFEVAVPLRALPAGSYRLRVEAGRASVGELWLDVGTITKPAYRLTIAPDRRAVTSGERVSVALHGSFFEGTPVAGTRIELVPDEGRGTKVTTDAEGDATGSVRLDMPYEDEQWTVVAIQATPTLPEEAEIVASSTVAVFRGNHLVDVAGTVAAGRIRVTGRVTDVAFDRFEAASDNALWSVDPHGAPVPGADVQLHIEEHWAVRKQVGSAYDFVLKRVVPGVRVGGSVATSRRPRVTTGTDGTFATTTWSGPTAATGSSPATGHRHQARCRGLGGRRHHRRRGRRAPAGRSWCRRGRAHLQPG